MSQVPPPFLRDPPLDRELSRGLAALRSFQPSAALLTSVEYALEERLLNEGLGAVEATSSGVRFRPALAPVEPQVARASVPWGVDESLATQAGLSSLPWRAVALSGLFGALAATGVICVLAYRGGEVRAGTAESAGTSAGSAQARGTLRASGSGAVNSAASLPARNSAGEGPARGLASESRPPLAESRGSAPARTKSGVSARPKPEPSEGSLDALALAGAAQRAGGVLNINSIPLSKVVLDGRPLGGTPRVQVPVVAGYHTVVFIHPERGRMQKQVHVEAGRTVLAAVRFD